MIWNTVVLINVVFHIFVCLGSYVSDGNEYNPNQIKILKDNT